MSLIDLAGDSSFWLLLLAAVVGVTLLISTVIAIFVIRSRRAAKNNPAVMFSRKYGKYGKF